MKEKLLYLYDIVRHMDKHLAEMSAACGGWMYAILFAVIFAETGLVVTPFLPGDSLLFAVGALIALPESGLNFPTMFITLLIAAIAGDAVNYWIGRAVGPKVFHSETGWLLNKHHLLKAQQFYEKYGGKAVFLARFAPIVRTFAPFVAGIGRMNLGRFWMFNIVGAICWVGAFLTAGYLFGNVPIVKRYFHLVIIGIIIVSLLPIAVEWYQAKRQDKSTLTQE